MMGKTLVLLIVTNIFTGAMVFLSVAPGDLFKTPLVIVPVSMGVILFIWLIFWLSDNWED